MRSALRITAALVSVVALIATGFGWWAVRGVLGGITISQALGADDPRSSGGATNILLIGLDSRKNENGDDLPKAILDKLHAGDSDSGGYNANTLILAHITPDNHVVAFSIPRDDYVAVNGIPGYSHVKIKEAYGLKKADAEQRLMDKGVTDQHQLEAQGREAGRSATLAAVRDLTGVPIDYFAEINLAGFYDLANSLGGVDVCLNHAVYDEYSGADFSAGRQTLDAAQALAFVRQRHGLDNGDLDRTHRQQAFLVSVMRKLQDSGTFTDLSKLNSVMDIARKDIVLSTGWSQEQFRRIGDILGGNVKYQTLPVLRYDNVDGQDVNIVDPTAIKSVVAAAFGTSTTTASTTDARPASTVDIINAGDTTGLAATIAQQLKSRGYTEGEVRNPFTGEPTETGIDYGPGSATDAQNLATLLGIDSSPRLDSTLEPDHIRVVIGRDYNPPANLNSGNASSDSMSASTGSSGSSSSSGRSVPSRADVDTTTSSETPDQGQPIDGGGVPCVN
jgi:LCP family protein required for cell wall assembly